MNDVNCKTDITLRNHFAAHALQGLLANPKLLPEDVEDRAFEIADAMVARSEEAAAGKVEKQIADQLLLRIREQTDVEP